MIFHNSLLQELCFNHTKTSQLICNKKYLTVLYDGTGFYLDLYFDENGVMDCGKTQVKELSSKQPFKRQHHKMVNYTQTIC